MPNLQRLRAATDDLNAAALMGTGWRRALGALARASDARHAVIMRNRPDRPVAAISNIEAADAIRDYFAGRVPPNSRYRHVLLRPADGFRVDHDDYTDDVLARDPYYQEFLRPIGVFWHANVRITSGSGEYVELSLKRDTRAGPYQREDANLLNVILPELFAAARMAKIVFDAESRGMVRLLRRHGGPVIELDGRGRVLAGQDDNAGAGTPPVRVVANRLVACHTSDQGGVDEAVHSASDRPGRVAVARVSGPDGRRHLLQVQPVPGVARDVFLSASALAVVVEHAPNARVVISSAGLRAAFGLTDREAEVARLIAAGFDIDTVARSIGIRPQTARTYLKDVLDKTGTHRQAEFVALCGRVSN